MPIIVTCIKYIDYPFMVRENIFKLTYFKYMTNAMHYNLQHYVCVHIRLFVFNLNIIHEKKNNYFNRGNR